MRKIAWVVLLLPLAALSATEFYVATDGNDASSGSKRRPFATLERARDAVRQLKDAGKYPGDGEHTGPLYGRPDAAPNNLIMGRDKKTPDPKIVAATAYYDTVNFARFVKVPALMSSGLIDTACPPMTVLSIYNTLSCPKQLDLVPLLGHNCGPRFMELKNHFLVEQAGIPNPSAKIAAPVIMGAPIYK